MPRNLPWKDKAPIWKHKSMHDRLQACRAQLYLWGFIQEPQSRRLFMKIEKVARASAPPEAGQ